MPKDLKPEEIEKEFEEAISAYYREGDVNVVIGIRAEAKEGERIAKALSAQEQVIDCFMVTGDTDLLVRARFKTYKDFKEFIINVIGGQPGIKESSSMMIVTAYKEGGRRF